MKTVTVCRTFNRCTRTTNGAWYGVTPENNTFEIEEEKLDKGFSLNSGIKVTWPDGTIENAFPFNGGASIGYPPICIPGNGRLSKLLNR